MGFQRMNPYFKYGDGMVDVRKISKIRYQEEDDGWVLSIYLEGVEKRSIYFKFSTKESLIKHKDKVVKYMEKYHMNGGIEPIEKAD